MTLRRLTEHHLEFLSLIGGCTSSSESPLVKMPHFWKFHALAQLFCFSTSVLTSKHSFTLALTYKANKNNKMVSLSLHMYCLSDEIHQDKLPFSISIKVLSHRGCPVVKFGYQGLVTFVVRIMVS